VPKATRCVRSAKSGVRA